MSANVVVIGAIIFSVIPENLRCVRGLKGEEGGRKDLLSNVVNDGFSWLDKFVKNY
jgi:hypothetical protein